MMWLPHLSLATMLDEQKRKPGNDQHGRRINPCSTIDLEGKSEALNGGGSVKQSRQSLQKQS